MTFQINGYMSRRGRGRISSSESFFRCHDQLKSQSEQFVPYNSVSRGRIGYTSFSRGRGLLSAPLTQRLPDRPKPPLVPYEAEIFPDSPPRMPMHFPENCNLYGPCVRGRGRSFPPSRLRPNVFSQYPSQMLCRPTPLPPSAPHLYFDEDPLRMRMMTPKFTVKSRGSLKGGFRGRGASTVQGGMRGRGAIHGKTQLKNAKNEEAPTKKEINKPWVTAALKNEITKKKKLQRKAKRTKAKEDWDTFKEHRNKLTSLLRESKQEYMKEHPEEDPNKILQDDPATVKQALAKADKMEQEDTGASCSFPSNNPDNPATTKQALKNAEQIKQEDTGASCSVPSNTLETNI